MKIKIDEIPLEGLNLDISEEGSSLVATKDTLGFTVVGTVDGHLEIGKVGEEFATIGGNLTATIATECSRCLRPIETGHSIVFKETLLLSADGAGGGEGKERELSIHDMDYTVMEEGELDTADIISAQVIEVVSGKPLCKESCKGLCHGCGKDLNEGACDCASPDDIDKRFAKLKGLKLK